MLIYSKYQSPRLKYVLNFIFGEVFRTKYLLTQNVEEIESHNGCRIAYTEDSIEGAFHIPVSGLLYEDTARSMVPEISSIDNFKILFPVQGKAELQYDVFASVFYMISRYEEYLPFDADRHGRFEASCSLALKENFLEIPIVDLWLKDLRHKIIDWFPGQNLQEGKFEFIPTCDIDRPYAVMHHSKLRTVAANMKASVNGLLNWRRNILKGRTRDPFDTYDDIEWLHTSHHIRPLFFYLCGPYSKYDKSIDSRSQAFSKLVMKTADFARIGIHPSYSSERKAEMLGREIGRLESITGRKPVASRQHYLKIRLPHTYRRLIEEGILEDYSMGYASAAGFRAGTCRPFYFFDLERNTETALRIFPFQVMDRTLKDYMRLSEEEAYNIIRSLVDSVYEVGGTFVSIWHNEAFSDHGEWKGWRETYIRMLDYISEK
jgi:hypothetical protein